MSILRGLNNGVSGLNAESEALGVVADNVANSGTSGFKQQRALFEDVLGQSLSQQSPSAGAGVRVGTVQQVFTQGTISHTGLSADLALSGDGFFVLSGSVGGLSGEFYGRSGAFHIDPNGLLASPSGLTLQGYRAGAGGVFAASVSDIELPTAGLAARPSQTVTLTANLDAAAAAPSAPWDPQNVELTSNFATSLTVYDSLGNARALTLAFRATTPGAFSWYALTDGGELSGGTSGQNVVLGEGALVFGSNGELQTSVALTPISADFSGATPGQSLDLVLDGLSRFDARFNVSALSQDGYSSGSAAGFVVDSQGVVSGLYSNGQRVPVAQLAIAKFRAQEGLGRAGEGLWIATPDSGSPALGAAGAGGRGTISQGALELSNVELGQQFVDLIAHQRGFQASSKVISTADDMLAELVALKR